MYTHSGMGDVDWGSALSTLTQAYAQREQIKANARAAAAAAVPVGPVLLPGAPVRMPVEPVMVLVAGLGALAVTYAIFGGRRRSRRR